MQQQRSTTTRHHYKPVRNSAKSIPQRKCHFRPKSRNKHRGQPTTSTPQWSTPSPTFILYTQQHWHDKSLPPSGATIHLQLSYRGVHNQSFHKESSNPQKPPDRFTLIPPVPPKRSFDNYKAILAPHNGLNPSRFAKDWGSPKQNSKRTSPARLMTYFAKSTTPGEGHWTLSMKLQSS